MPAIASITLCMITRDEAQLLGACLESVRGCVDQIVIVDTGSTDATVDIARAHGAEVVHFEWTGDFAAARNVALERVRGTHVLVLDADERLYPGAGDLLRSACTAADFGVALLPLHNADRLEATAEEVVTGRRRLGQPVYLPRLFPAHTSLRYQGRVHEVLVPNFAWLERETGFGARWLEAPLIHFGDVPSLRAARGKAERNTRLLEAELEAGSTDPGPAGYLAGEYFQQERFEEAEALAQVTWTQLIADHDALPPGQLGPSPVRLGGTLGLCLLRRDALEEALDVATRSLARSAVSHPNLLYIQGMALERLGRPGEALAPFSRAIEGAGLRLSTPAFHELIDLSRVRLASCLRAGGRTREALATLKPVRGRAVVAATLLRAEIQLERGQPTEALRWLGALSRLETPPPDVAALELAARTALGLGSDALPGSTSIDPGRWIEPRRQALL